MEDHHHLLSELYAVTPSRIDWVDILGCTFWKTLDQNTDMIKQKALNKRTTFTVSTYIVPFTSKTEMTFDQQSVSKGWLDGRMMWLF